MAKKILDKTMMRVSKKLTKFLKSKGQYGESYEQIIWRLIDDKK